MAEKISADDLERALSFLEHHERSAFPDRSDSKAASSVRAHIADLQSEADGLRKALTKAKRMADNVLFNIEQRPVAVGVDTAKRIFGDISKACSPQDRSSEEK